MHFIFLPRGIRNNNPGNIRLSKTRWQGQTPQEKDASFVAFTEPLWGVRALMRTLMTYYSKYGLDTIDSIMNRYAPPHENATDDYARYVAKVMKIRRRDVIQVGSDATLTKLAQAIIRYENGTPPEDWPEYWYTPDVYASALTHV